MTTAPSTRAVKRKAATGLEGYGRALFALALLVPVGCSLSDTSDLFESPTSASSEGAGGSGSGSGSGSGNGSGSGSGNGSGSGSGSGSGGATSSSSGGPSPVAICVNEVMPDNDTALVVGMGATPDWIELHNPTNMDVDLEGWSLTNDETNPKQSVLPKGLLLPAKGFLILYATGDASPGPEYLSFSLAAGGGFVGLFAPDGMGSVLTYGQTDADVAQARKPDCCEGDACIELDPKGTPGKSNTTPKPQTVIALPEGSMYRFWDKGSLPGPTWTDPAFDDSAWTTGVAPLGYGDPHIVTTVGYGVNLNSKYITTWFRAAFDVKNAASVTSATVEVMRDDGALAFVNGVEVARSNMPNGAVLPNTQASTSVNGAGETTFFSFPLDPALLVDGKNVLAIEVHQSSATSSDMGMDARVTVEQTAP